LLRDEAQKNKGLAGIGWCLAHGERWRAVCDKQAKRAELRHMICDKPESLGVGV